MNLYICSTYYHVLITVLKSLNMKKKFDIAITDYIPEHKALVDRISRSTLFNQIIVLEQWIPRNRLECYFFGYLNVFNIEKKYGKLFEKYEEIYIYMDDICFARYLKDKHIYYNLLEDGFDSFKVRKDSAYYYMVSRKLRFRDKVRNLLFKHNTQNYKYFFNCPYVKTIELNDVKGTIFNENDNRIIVLPRYMLFDKINDINVNDVIKIFIDNTKILNEDNIALILTCCFFDDGYLNDIHEQVLLYKNICTYYKKIGYTPIIKPHPRDSIDYTKCGLKAINRFFPAELLRYLSIENIKKYVSIYSTSINNFPQSKVDYYESINEFYEIFNKSLLK